MTFQVEGLNELIADLIEAPAEVTSKARGVVQRGALNVKRDAQRFASGLQHAPHYPRSITYDTEHTGYGARGEIGPDKDLPGRQGGLGNLLEYGTSKNPPFAHLGPALDLEGPKFEKALGDLGLLAVEGGRMPDGPGEDAEAQG